MVTTFNLPWKVWHSNFWALGNPLWYRINVEVFLPTKKIEDYATQILRKSDEPEDKQDTWTPIIETTTSIKNENFIDNRNLIQSFSLAHGRKKNRYFNVIEKYFKFKISNCRYSKQGLSTNSSKVFTYEKISTSCHESQEPWRNPQKQTIGNEKGRKICLGQEISQFLSHRWLSPFD